MYEILKGLTDIPIFIFSLVVCILIYSKNNKSNSFYSFLLLGFTSLGGIILHCFKIKEIYLSIFWIIECILLMITVSKMIFFVINKDILKIFKILIIVFIVPIILSRIYNPRLDIYFSLLYSLIALIYMVYVIIKEKINIKNKNIIIIFLILTLLSQILKDIIPYGVLIGHLLMVIDLYYIYLIIKDR